MISATPAPAARPRRSKATQRAETTRLLLNIGLEIFATEGYANAATEVIAMRGGVTRGALYHNFGSKEGLFAAVLEEVQAEIAQQVLAAASAESAPWDQLRAGCHAFLRAALHPQVQRIALIDAPAVLGWDAWRAADERHSYRLLVEALQELAASGEITDLSPTAAARLLSGAMNDAALWIAQSPDREAALHEAGEVLDRLLAGLRTPES